MHCQVIVAMYWVDGAVRAHLRPPLLPLPLPLRPSSVLKYPDWVYSVVARGGLLLVASGPEVHVHDLPTGKLVRKVSERRRDRYICQGRAEQGRRRGDHPRSNLHCNCQIVWRLMLPPHTPLSPLLFAVPHSDLPPPYTPPQPSPAHHLLSAHTHHTTHHTQHPAAVPEPARRQCVVPGGHPQWAPAVQWWC